MSPELREVYRRAMHKGNPVRFRPKTLQAAEAALTAAESDGYLVVPALSHRASGRVESAWEEWCADREIVLAVAALRRTLARVEINLSYADRRLDRAGESKVREVARAAWVGRGLVPFVSARYVVVTVPAADAVFALRSLFDLVQELAEEVRKGGRLTLG